MTEQNDTAQGKYRPDEQPLPSDTKAYIDEQIKNAVKQYYDAEHKGKKVEKLLALG